MWCPMTCCWPQTDPALVQFEMDIGWVVAGGADPVAYLTKYPSATIHCTSRICGPMECPIPAWP